MNLPEALKISVVMSVYNGADTLKRSVESILQQTYADFELIIVNDGSTDETSAQLNIFADHDSRIRLLSSPSRQGLTRSLMRAIHEACGTYIARQDADDWSDPRRLRTQLSFMEQSSKSALIGSWFRISDEKGAHHLKTYPDEDQTLRRLLLTQNPFCHASVMFPKHFYEKAGGYNPDFETGQDLDLWLRLAQLGELRMVESYLVEKCVSASSRRKAWKQVRDGFRIRWKHRFFWPGKRNRIRIFGTAFYQILITCLPLGWIVFLRTARSLKGTAGLMK
ncbi:MAG: glycosyltransferase [Candidatus Omnitrophica bacterium]|nr:glycosyltransferase [Candidatus Omnitrophota bacterium]